MSSDLRTRSRPSGPAARPAPAPAPPPLLTRRPPPPARPPRDEPAATWGFDPRRNALRAIGVEAPRRPAPPPAPGQAPSGLLNARALQQAEARRPSGSATQPPMRPVGPAPGTTPRDPAADARTLHDAMRGGLAGIGTDEQDIFQTLEGRSPQELSSIRNVYRDRYGRDLDRDIHGELSGSDLRRAQALLSGNETAARADAVRQSIDRVGTNERRLFEQLEGLTPTQSRDLQREYRARHGSDLRADLASDLTGPDLVRANALLDGNRPRAAAAELEQAMRGAGTDEQAIYDRLQRGTPAERRAMERAYLQEFGRPVDVALRSELSGASLDRARALLAGDSVRARAAQAREASAGFGTDEEGLEDALRDASPAERSALRREYREMYGRDLDTEIRGELSGERLTEVQEVARTGQGAEAVELRRAVRGLGTDEGAIQSILAGKTPAEIAAIERDYRARYGSDLRADIAADTSGRDQFDANMALAGAVDTSTDAGLAESVRRARATRDFERSGAANVVGRVLVDAVSDSGRNLDRNTARAEAALAEARRDGHIDDDERARIQELTGYSTGDAASFRESRDAAGKTVSTVAATAVGVAVTATGVGSPVGALILGAVAVGATKAATTAAISGRGTTVEDVATNFATGAFDTALGGAGGLAARSAVVGVVEQTAARRLATEALRSGRDSAISSGFATGLNDDTWREGFGSGVGNVLNSSAQAAVSAATVPLTRGALARTGRPVRGLASAGPPAPRPPAPAPGLAQQIATKIYRGQTAAPIRSVATDQYRDATGQEEVG